VRVIAIMILFEKKWIPIRFGSESFEVIESKRNSKKK